jgi:hypothetical protein
MAEKVSIGGSRREPSGRFSKGGPGGPGRRPHRTAAEGMFTVARMLSDPEHGARTTVELAREISPALLRRVAERGLDPNTPTRDVIECARLVLDRAYGKPVESVALAHADMNASGAADRHQRAQAALARLRDVFGKSELAAFSARCPDEPDA